MDLVLVLLGLSLTLVGANWLVRGAGSLASRFELSPFVVGLTVVSLGTSAPELFVAADSALRGAGDLVLGNVLGSNLANVGLILGLTALIRPVAVESAVVRRDLPFMLLVTLLLFPVLTGARVDRVEGLLLLCLLPIYLVLLTRSEHAGERLASVAELLPEPAPLWRQLGLLTIGLAGLILGAELLVSGALSLARNLGISEVAVGLTVVAVGTSVPELATSAVATLRGESGIALGNVVGSNIANTTLVLGTAALLEPIEVAPGLVSRELPIVLLLSVLALPLAWTEMRLQRWEGGLLLASYAAVTVWLMP